MDHASTPAEAANLGRRSLEAAEQAIALDPDLAEGYAARGLLRAIIRWDWRGAQLDMDSALLLAAGDANTQRRSAILLAALGRHDEAIGAARKAVEIDPLFAANWKALGGYYVQTNQLVAARSASFERYPDERGRLVGMALAQHALNQMAEARRTLDALISRYGERYPVTIGATYACWGDLDRAFEWLDRAYARHDVELIALKEHVVLAPKLHGDPRFTALLRKMNLPVD